MNIHIARQNQIQKKLSKNIEKTAKMNEIKEKIEEGFQAYLKEKEEKKAEKIDKRKLKLELNQLIFQNMSKEKTLHDLKNNLKALKVHRRSYSVQGFSQGKFEDRIEELKTELSSVIDLTDKETAETELLQSLKTREKSAFSIISEKVSKLQSSQNDLKGYSEKLIRTNVLADNLYATSSNFLKTSRKEVFSQKSQRKSLFRELRKKEVKLNSQVELMKSKLTEKIYLENEKEYRVKAFSTRLESLIHNNQDNEQESNLNVKYIHSVKFVEEKLVNLIKNSKFIPAKNRKISLVDVPKYLDVLAFAESQLHVRSSELISLQSSCKSDLRNLKTEISEIKGKFKDSQVILNICQKIRFEDKQSIKFGEITDVTERNIQELENLCLSLQQTLYHMQDHINKIVKKINLLSIETQNKITRSTQMIKKRTLSNRSSFSILPVIKDSTRAFSPFEFESMVYSLVSEKFNKSNQQANRLIRTISKYNILKNNLGASELIEFFSSSSSFDEAINSFFKLFKPAHLNIRYKVVNIAKVSVAFINGISIMSKQVLDCFERDSLTENQLNKYLALFPGLKVSDRNLKEIVEEVIRSQVKNYSIENHRKMIKKKVLEGGKRNSVFKEMESPVVEKFDSKERMRHKRSTTQKELKNYIDELNMKLVKSSKKM